MRSRGLILSQSRSCSQAPIRRYQGFQVAEAFHLIIMLPNQAVITTWAHSPVVYMTISTFSGVLAQLMHLSDLSFKRFAHF
jgi:hypothetical protein